MAGVNIRRIIAVFSAAFPIYQAHRGKKKWTLFYLPVACFMAAVPLIMMGGIPRPSLAAVVIAFGVYTLWRRAQSGWTLNPDEADDLKISEG